MSHPAQMALPLPTRAALGRSDFYVTEANALAVAQIEGWRLWPSGKFVLSGPAGAGKTHLAHVWARLTGATILPAAALAQADIPMLAEGPVCVEDIETIAGDTAAEEALFHLHNLVLAQGHKLLMTARQPAARWGLSLPDLQSRAMGAQGAELSEPDDDLLSALIAKLFSDRQIVPAGDVVPYLARRIPRSYTAAQLIVEILDREALGRPKGVSRPLAIAVFDRLFAPKLLPMDDTST
ncbi:P-loop NTPase family protein [Tropicibacter oceani]|uniref:Chromosomal replication initiator DnaA n=1 Tax=Tropicibacter oceani TaxID=3058420 RepID=A0ABY8QCP9_9RHOB|nr:chromosomal replication initiator DnaA [Tropicibacter oceani]WGW02259.1 chromosomal replication initiator DnaA [Tropicibacter oceani]